MKKNFLITSVFLLFSSLLFNSCNALVESFNEDVKDYMKKYTETAEIAAYVLDGDYPLDSKGYINLPSDSNRKITFYLINPQNFNFTDPSNIKYSIKYQDDAETVINNFNVANSSAGISAYTFIQDPLQIGDYALIEYTFSEKFLQETDGGLNLSPEITFTNPNTDNQNFDPYTGLKIVSNSAPLSVRNLTVLTDPVNNTYVLGFFMPDMSGIHKDIKKIIINNGEDIEYPVTLSANPSLYDTGMDFSAGSLFTNNSTFYNTLVSGTNGVTLDTSDPTRIVFYKTGVELSEEVNPFSVVLEDERGLSSIAKVTDKSEKLKTPTINPENLSDLVIDKTGYATIEISAQKTTASGSTVDGDITIYYILTHAGTFYKQGQGINKINVQIATGAYKLETWAHKPGYIDSDSIFRNFSSSGYVFVKPSYTGELRDGGQLTPYCSIEEAINAVTQDGITNVLIMLLEDVTLASPITVENYNLTINGNGMYSVGTQIPLTAESQSFEVKPTYELILKNVKSGKVKVNQGSEFTLTGSTTVNTIELAPNTKFYTSQLAAGTTQIAKIKITNDSGLVKDAVIIESKDTSGLSEADIARFELNNAGYFLKRSADGKGVIGSSEITVVSIDSVLTDLEVNVENAGGTNPSEVLKFKVVKKGDSSALAVRDFKVEALFDDKVIHTWQDSESNVITVNKNDLPALYTQDYSAINLKITFKYRANENVNEYPYEAQYLWEY